MHEGIEYYRLNGLYRRKAMGTLARVLNKDQTESLSSLLGAEPGGAPPPPASAAGATGGDTGWGLMAAIFKHTLTKEETARLCQLEDRAIAST